MKINYAVFDLDGTLLDSMHLWDNIRVEILEEHSITPPKDFQDKLAPLSIMQSAEYIKEEFTVTLSVEEIADMIAAKAKENYKCKIDLKPYVKEYLEKLRGQKVRMGIATANDDQITREVLKRLGILDYFEFIITCSQVGCSKEEPKIYMEAADKFGCAPQDIAVFEDALYCIRTAKNAGFYVVGVADEYSRRNKDEIKCLCDFYIDSFKELEDVN